MAHKKPDYCMIVNGQDITPTLRGWFGQRARLESFTLTDHRGGEADELSMTLDDSDGMIAIPEKGAKIKLAFGWEDEGLVDKGEFIVDQVEHHGTPDQLSIQARSADFRKALRQKKDKSFHQSTLGNIAKDIASTQKLELKISKELQNIPIHHIDQTNESDINFLTRLCAQYGAFCAIKENQLLIMTRGGHQTISGEKIKAAVFIRQDGDNHHFRWADRDEQSGMCASYHDPQSAKQIKVTAGNHDDQTGNLRHSFPNQASAQAAAEAALRAAKHKAATLSLSLALGRADLIPDMPAKVKGWKPEIDGMDWTIVKITHNFSNSGFTTQVDFEVGGA